jgi:hypothetical protein
MHVDTILLELEYFNYDNVKPFKINFPYNRFKRFRFFLKMYIKCSLYLGHGKTCLKHLMHAPCVWIS